MTKKSNKIKKVKKKSSVVKKMTEEKLDESTEDIRTSNRNVRKLVTEIELTKGWEAKKYSSFKVYCVVELVDEISYDTLNRHRRVGLVEFNVVGKKAVGRYKAEPIMQIVEADLLPKQQKEVWQRLQKKCGHKHIPSSWLTTKRVIKALIKLGYVDDTKDEGFTPPTEIKPEPKVKSFNSNDEQHDDGFNLFTDDVEDESDAGIEGGEIGLSRGIEKRPMPERDDECAETNFFDCVDQYSKDEMKFEKSIACSIKETFDDDDILHLCATVLKGIDISTVKRLYRHLKINAK